VNNHPDTTFILPVGTGQKAKICLRFFANHVKRNVVLGHVPTALIDSDVVIIPAKNLTDLPQISGLYLEKPDGPKTKTGWTLENERQMYQFLYGS
jgi:hypothetical protein